MMEKRSSNFASFKPPARPEVEVHAVESENGAELHAKFRRPDVPAQGRIAALAARMAAKYVPFEYRVQEPNKDAKEPVDFPPLPGQFEPIILTEDACMGFAAATICQIVEDGEEPLSFETWVFCSITCPTGFAQVVKLLNGFGDDAGNAQAGGTPA